MDTVDLPAADLAACLADLERVNRLTRAAAPTLAFLERLTRGWPQGAELRLLDAGSGEGAMLRRIRRFALARGLRPRLVGVDINPKAALAARAAGGEGIEWVTADIFEAAPRFRPHVVTSALFAHHLDDAGVVRFLRLMEETASHGWFVNDLERHPLAFHGFRLLAGLMRWHRFVRHDGPVSIARAFVAADWARYLAAAGIAGATLHRHVPFRLCVARLKPCPTS
ncbi:methyltransferase domain-containing protein [Thermaurantiacus sp.]